MYFYFGFYSSILLIFFVHGLVYCFLLFKKGIANDTNADKWLGLFLLLSVLYIAPWMLGFAGWYDTQPYRDILFYIPFQHLFFMGPIVFFYVQSLLNQSFQFRKKDSLHFIPGILYLLYALIVFITDKCILHEYYFYADGADKDFAAWYQILGCVSMIIYFLSSLKYYTVYKQLVQQVTSYADTVLFTWVRNFLIAFLGILIVRIFFFILSIFIDVDYGGNWWGFFAFSILFYYIAVSGYANAVKTKMYFKTNLFTQRTTLLLSAPNQQLQEETFTIFEEVEPNNNTVAIEEDAVELHKINEWKEKLLEEIVGNELYKNAELSLTDLSKRLKTNASILSKTINKGFGMNFNDFINYYRVQMVIEMLQQGEHKKQTLLGIAFDCGFNSKATFNRAFKKVTQKSPKEWIEQSS